MNGSTDLPNLRIPSMNRNGLGTTTNFGASPGGQSQMQVSPRADRRQDLGASMTKKLRAVSRQSGDAIVHKFGVTAEPELIEHPIDEFDEFLIIASDGVWDVVDNNHAVQMVHNFAVRSQSWNPLEAANCLVKFARSRWEKLSPMIDDITCIVIKLQPISVSS
eukprot:gene4049-2885_t